MAGDPALLIAKEVGGLVAQPAFEALKEYWNCIKNCDNNVDEIQRVHKSLRDLRDETKQKVNLGDRNNQEAVPEIRDWLEEVDKFLGDDEEELKELLLDKEARKKAEECCFGFCWSPKYRYYLSKKAEEQTSNINKKIHVLRERGETAVTLDAEPLQLITIPCAFVKGLKSREKQLMEILDMLKDDKVNRIGVHGMGGAGKTTLVQELARRCEREKMFDAIVLAEISEFPDFKRIQDQIAERIGFSFLGHYHNIEERAINLCHRLMRIRNGKRLYSKTEQHGATMVEKLVHAKDETVCLSKAPTIQNLSTLTSTKEEKINRLHENDRPKIIEKAQIIKDKHVEGDTKEGLEKGKSCTKDEKDKGTEKTGKLLIVLDNMWENIDLHLVGIPFELEKDSGCKIIVTSRNEGVCKTMGASNISIFKVGDLDDDEAMQLFREKVGEIADKKGYKNITTKLLKKCSHLPLSINLLANTLKNRPLSVWERVLKQLENPVEKEVEGVSGKIYSAIEMSYKYLGNKEKQKFFLLCCIFPPGSKVSIIHLLRYGIGLDLFQYADSIVEALDQAYQWANDLKSASLLIEVDIWKGIISIHDDVRKAGKSFATEGGYAFHVGAIPNMMKSYLYQKFKVISITSNNSFGLLDGETLPELQLLRFSSVNSLKLSEKYFMGMTNLKVLDMSKSIIEEFPSSFVDLMNLEILLLEYCSLKVFSQIFKLMKLLVLSFKGSNITTLPEDMRALVELKLLDLTNCNKLKHIPCGIFVCLKRLEGLYMKQSFSDWTTDGSKASLVELASLPLKVLEIDIQFISQLPKYDFLDLDVSNYNIDVAMSTPPQLEHDQIICSRNLRIGKVPTTYLLKKGWKLLMKKVESLSLHDINHSNVSPSLGESWMNLKRITVSGGWLIYFIDPHAGFQPVSFPKLENLQLEGIEELTSLYYGMCPTGFFSSLQELTLLGLSELHTCDIDIDSATKLRVLEVNSCEKLVSIFSIPIVVHFKGRGSGSGSEGQGEASCNSHAIRFPFMRKLILANLPSLQGFLFEETNAEATKQLLFPKQVIFPCLDKINLERLNQIKELWDTETGQEFVTVFPKLRSISLKYLNNIKYVWRTAQFCEASFSPRMSVKKLKFFGCDTMKIVCPLSIATTLYELELLRIHNCGKVNRVISNDERTGKHDIRSKLTMSFPKLLTLDLRVLHEFTYFYQGIMEIGFPALKSLMLHILPQMKTLLAKVDTPQECRKKDDGILFNGELEFPSLERLYAKTLDNIEELWDSKIQRFAMMFPSLQKISLFSMRNLKHVWNEELIRATPVSIDLKEISIEDCDSLESLFAPSTTSTNYTNAKVKFAQLMSIKMKSLKNFRCILQGNVKIEFPVLKIILLHNLTEMVALDKLGKPMASGEKGSDTPLFNREMFMPFLEHLELKQLDKVEQIWDMTKCEELSIAFPRLKILYIVDLPKIKYIWSDELNEKILCFRSLEYITVMDCDKMESFFSSGKKSCSLQHQYQKLVSFPRLQALVLANLQRFKCFLQRQCLNMDFHSLKLLVVRLPLVKTLVKLGDCSDTRLVIESHKKNISDERENPAKEDGGYNDKENSLKAYDMIKADQRAIVEDDVLREDSILFNGNVRFSSLEQLKILCMSELESICENDRGDENDDDTTLSSSVFPQLIRLHLEGGDVIKMNRMLKTMLHKLESLLIRRCNNLRYFVSSNKDTISVGGALVDIKSRSELETLKELTIEDCDSLEELLEVEDHDMMLLSTLRMLKLTRLAKLKSVQWHKLPNLQSLSVGNCPIEGNKFLIETSVATLESLENMEITDCADMEAIIGTGKVEIQNDDEVIFPRLKEVIVEQMISLCMFSSIRGRVSLPSLVSVEFNHCAALNSFSLGPIDAPKLHKLKVNSEPVAIAGDLNTTLHQEFCANYEIGDYWPKILWHKSHVHELKLVWEDEVRICKYCSNPIALSFYCCEICKLNLHPKCALEDADI